MTPHHDALGVVIGFGLQNEQMPMLGGEAVTLTVETHIEDLLDPNGVATFIDAHGKLAVTDSSLARYSACVGGIYRVFNKTGQQLVMETGARGFNAHQRRVILLRDGGCVIPGCDVSPIWCEIHHVQEHAKGGKTSIDNGVMLCWHHHRNIETSGWLIRIRKGRPEVIPPDHYAQNYGIKKGVWIKITPLSLIHI